MIPSPADVSNSKKDPDEEGSGDHYKNNTHKKIKLKQGVALFLQAPERLPDRGVVLDDRVIPNQAEPRAQPGEKKDQPKKKDRQHDNHKTKPVILPGGGK